MKATREEARYEEEKKDDMVCAKQTSIVRNGRTSTTTTLSDFVRREVESFLQSSNSARESL